MLRCQATLETLRTHHDNGNLSTEEVRVKAVEACELLVKQLSDPRTIELLKKFTSPPPTDPKKPRGALESYFRSTLSRRT